MSDLPSPLKSAVPWIVQLAETLGGYWRQVGIEVAQRQVDPTQYQAQTIGLQLFNDFALNATSANAWTGIFNYGSSLLHRSPGPEQADVDELLNRIRKIAPGKVNVPVFQQPSFDQGLTVIFDVGPATLMISERSGSAGNVPDAYRAFGIEPKHLLSAVIMTAPGSKLPRTAHSGTGVFAGRPAEMAAPTRPNTASRWSSSTV